MKSMQNEEQQKMLSINELLAIQRVKYPKRPQWLFRLHMAFLMSWLTIQHGNLKTLIAFWLMLVYKAYIYYKALFVSVVLFIIYWIAIDLKAGFIAGCAVLICCLIYNSFKQFKKEISA
jgi:hypothetical protein